MCQVHDRRAGASLIDTIQDGQGELQALWIAAKSTAQAMRDDAQELLDRLRSMRVRLDRAIAWLERECPPSIRAYEAPRCLLTRAAGGSRLPHGNRG